VGLRSDLDAMEYKKISCPCRGSKPGRPVIYLLIHHLMMWSFSHTIRVECPMVGRLVRSDLDRICKEMSWTVSRHSQHLPRSTEETHENPVMITGFRPDI
jgi:hypothetical protein